MTLMGVSVHAQPPPQPAPPTPTTPAPATPTPATPAPGTPAPAESAAAATPEPTPPSALASEPSGAAQVAPDATQPLPPQPAVASNAEGAAALDLPRESVQPATPREAIPASQASGHATPLSVSGSFLTRYELRGGFADQGLVHPRQHREGDNFVYRARLGLATHPADLGEGQSIEAHFVPQAHGVHATQGTPPTVGDSYELRLYEAFIRWRAPRLTLDMGRFEMNYGHGVVIGTPDWSEAGRAFQGARLHYVSPKKYWVDLFATLINEGRPTTAAIFDGDVFFYGAYVGLGGLFSDAFAWDFYLLAQSANQQQVETSGPTDPTPTFETLEGATELTLGTRVAHNLARFDYQLEAGVQFGDAQTVVGEPTISRFAYQAEGEFGVVPTDGLRLALGGLVASGDGDLNDDESNAWNELYSASHAFLGLSDVFGGRTNALSGYAKASYEASKRLVLKLDAHLLSRMEKGQTGESFVGTEIDAQVISPLGQGAVMRGLYSAFLTNADYWPSDDAIHYVEVQFSYSFK